MSRTRRLFTTEDKVEAAHRGIDSGRTIAEVARELGINEAFLGRWIADERRHMEAATVFGDQPLTAAERAELARLRKQVTEQEKNLAFLKSVRVFRSQSAKVEIFALTAVECANSAVHFDGTSTRGVDLRLLQHQGRSVATRLGDGSNVEEIWKWRSIRSRRRLRGAADHR